MKGNCIALLLILVAIMVSACGDGFPDEEMHLGLEDKVRPYGVVVEPAEAAPGDTVQVTLYAQVPNPNELDITWRVALDYDLGLYGTDEVERNYRNLAVPMPTVDSDGFLSQTFQWVVPDSALLYASALPQILNDPAMIFLAEELIGPEAGSPPTKSAVDSWLKEMTVDESSFAPPMETVATWALADRFACQVRFRATLRTDRIIDVTRNLTIRHTKRLNGPNTNTNPAIWNLSVVDLPKADASVDDLNDPAIEKTIYPIIDFFWSENDPVQIPVQAGHTYYLKIEPLEESFSSPFDPGLFLTERVSYHWYYYRQDNPTSDHNFFVTEEGEGAQMWDLDDEARIMPDGGGSVFRVTTVTRDFRDNWVQYHATPGVTLTEFILEFVAP